MAYAFEIFAEKRRRCYIHSQLAVALWPRVFIAGVRFGSLAQPIAEVRTTTPHNQDPWLEGCHFHLFRGHNRGIP